MAYLDLNQFICNNAVLRRVTFALILHPIAAAVVLIAIIVSLTNNVILGKFPRQIHIFMR